MEPVTSLIDRAEKGIAGLLAPLAALGFEFPADVETLPETKEGIQEAILTPRVTVSYMASTFGDVRQNESAFIGLGSPAGQDETLQLAVTIRAKGRAKGRGVYPTLELVRRLLLGKVPFPGARGLWFTAQQLDDFEERGNWRYMLTVATLFTITAEEPIEELISGVGFAWNPPDPPLL